MIVHPQSELIREPNLLVLGKKPVGNVRLDRSSSLSPNQTFVLFNKVPLNNIDYVTNKFLGISGTGLLRQGTAFGPIIDIPTGANYFTLPATIQLTTTDPYEITWQCKTDGVQQRGGICGDPATTIDFIWMREGNYINLRNAGANLFTSLTSFADAYHTYSITSDGGGAAACTLKAYKNGSHIQTLTSKDGDLKITAIGCGHSNALYAFEGGVSYFRISTGKYYSAEEIHCIHNDPYQFLVPS